MLFPLGNQAILPDSRSLLAFDRIEEDLTKVRAALSKPFEDLAAAALQTADFVSITSEIFKGPNQAVFQNLLAGLTPPQSFYSQLEGFARLASGSGQFWPDLQRWKEEYEEGIAVLTAHGWWPHPYWPVRIIRNVFRLKREKQLRQLDRWICDTYDEDNFLSIKEAVQAWNVLPEYKERSRIFKTGLEAYLRRDYISAVSVWLPQVEGVLRARAVRDGFSTKSWKRTITILGQETALAEIDSMIVGDFFRFFHALYKGAKKKPPKKELPIRRHVFVHGTDLTFGRRANAMSVFLMLDTIHYFLLEYGNKAQVPEGSGAGSGAGDS